MTIKFLLKEIKANKIFNSILLLSSGTAGAQIIALLFIPIITRLYGPESYGQLGIFLSILTILTPLATLSISSAIVIPKSNLIARELVTIALKLASINSFLIFIILLFFGDNIFEIIEFNDFNYIIYLLPLAMFLSALHDISNQISIRLKEFHSIAKTSIIHSIINYGMQALLGYYSPYAIILSFVHTTSLGVRALLLSFFRRYNLIVNKNTSIKRKFILLKWYKSFVIYRTPQMILNAISQSIPVLLLSYFFGPLIVGYYALTRTVLGVPISLLSRSVQSVFTPYFNDLINNNKLARPFLTKSTKSLAISGLVPFLLIIILGPSLFEIIFGDEWVLAGSYAQWLSLWLFFALINGPSIAAIPILNLQKWYLIYEITSVIIRFVIIFSFSFYYNDALLTVAMFSLSSAMLNLYLIYKVNYFAKIEDERLNLF